MGMSKLEKTFSTAGIVLLLGFVGAYLYATYAPSQISYQVNKGSREYPPYWWDTQGIFASHSDGKVAATRRPVYSPSVKVSDPLLDTAGEPRWYRGESGWWQAFLVFAALCLLVKFGSFRLVCWAIASTIGFYFVLELRDWMSERKAKAEQTSIAKSRLNESQRAPDELKGANSNDTAKGQAGTNASPLPSPSASPVPGTTFSLKAQPTKTKPTVKPYTVELALAGPVKLNPGESAELTLSAKMVEIELNQDDESAGTVKDYLSPKQQYTANAELTAVSYERDSIKMSSTPEQPLALSQPAVWKWQLTPKEKKLGRQVISTALEIQEKKKGGRAWTKYLSANVEITDPLGIPPTLIYLGIALGAVLGAPGVPDALKWALGKIKARWQKSGRNFRATS